jgi:hypothetical protein
MLLVVNSQRYRFFFIFQEMSRQGALSRLRSRHVIGRVRFLDDPGTGGSAIGIALPNVVNTTIHEDLASAACDACEQPVTYPRALKIASKTDRR